MLDSSPSKSPPSKVSSNGGSGGGGLFSSFLPKKKAPAEEKPSGANPASAPIVAGGVQEEEEGENLLLPNFAEDDGDSAVTMLEFMATSDKNGDGGRDAPAESPARTPRKGAVASSTSSASSPAATTPTAAEKIVAEVTAGWDYTSPPDDCPPSEAQQSSSGVSSTVVDCDEVSDDGSDSTSPSPAKTSGGGGASPGGSAGSGGSRRNVSFSPRSAPGGSKSLSKRGLVEMKEEDTSLSREQLLEAVSELRDKVERYKVNLSAEKAVRKKKEKNMMKLAKELNGRVGECGEKGREIEELLSSNASLETRLSTSRASLTSLSLQSESDSRSRHEEITRLQSKLRKLRSEYDERIAALTTTHERQCEELRRDALRSRLDADRTRAERAREEMILHPERAAAIVERAASERGIVGSMNGGGGARRGGTTRRKKGSEMITVPVFLGVLLMANLLRWAYTFHRDGVFSSRDALCSPAYPGTVLGGSGGAGNDDGRSSAERTFEAPWWAPVPFRSAAFNALCLDSDD
eukprot:CAMPEP_0113535626 /NCGR_PEP_ID=MMETSP0015_2-20120614/5813_1 /TAXON_ID=2838 /ORGANISM="Odontella" /LENGTH=520 /DNA_ID=CAMNT_0000434907 /DNA_START=202 /DNA_END=1762 /DNA_ORIENTATION=+ /assembly_acc=CAM_ASM_000160